MDKPVGHSRIDSLQALRGIAAALVVVAHTIEHAPGPAGNSVLLTGRIGVDIFFVISGFVIAHVASEGTFSPTRFLARRVWRVAPLYWALTIFVALLAFAAPALFETTTFNFDYLIRSLLFIPAPLPETNDWRPLFKLGWTLNYEMFFYVVLTGLYWCRTALQRGAIVTAIMAGLIGASFLVAPKSGIFAFYANLHLMPFVAGVWLSLLWRRGAFRAKSSAVALALIVGSTLMSGWYYTLPFNTATSLAGGHLIMSLTATLICATALWFERVFSGTSPFSKLGNISYSLYLVHMFVVGIGWAILNRLGIAQWSPLGVIGMAGIIIGSLVAAQISYAVFEKQLMKLAPGTRKTRGR